MIHSQSHCVDISHHLQTIRQSMAELAARHSVPAPRLMAVSKFQPEQAIRAALAGRQRLFGENRVQEAAAKFPQLRQEFPDLELHLIGPLQRNKAKEALEHFDAIQTLDRPALAEALASLWPSPTRRVQRLMVQINTGLEPQKAGIAPSDAASFIAWARDELKLPITGLMCIPPADDAPWLHFAWLKQLANHLNLPETSPLETSMGMSHDYPHAIRYGTSIIRVGTAIFGERHSS